MGLLGFRHARGSLVIAFSALALLGAHACANAPERTFSTPITSSSTAGGNGVGGIDPGFSDGGPPPLDAGGLCGNEAHQIIFDAPNIYFVLDVSGSMSTIANAKNQTRYDVLRGAALDVVRDLGALINVGAAVFPFGATNTDVCHVGKQVFALSPGDPYNNGQDGPTTIKFAKATNVLPNGGTPTAATLAGLLPALKGFSGKTIVILATDGGPNCDDAAMCDAAHCITNIEGVCDPNINCCAPGGPVGPDGCLDDMPTVSAISDIHNAGIPVYVVGIPGSEIYADTLNSMAIAGGAPQFAPPYYYAVKNVATLEATIASIASVVVSCTFELQNPPDTQDMTNVYFDGTVVPYDPVNGWTWKSKSEIELHGQACARLKKGQVKQVQIVSGCPTEMPK